MTAGRLLRPSGVTYPERDGGTGAGSIPARSTVKATCRRALLVFGAAVLLGSLAPTFGPSTVQASAPAAITAGTIGKSCVVGDNMAGNGGVSAGVVFTIKYKCFFHVGNAGSGSALNYLEPIKNLNGSGTFTGTVGVHAALNNYGDSCTGGKAYTLVQGDLRYGDGSLAEAGGDLPDNYFELSVTCSLGFNNSYPNPAITFSGGNGITYFNNTNVPCVDTSAGDSAGNQQECGPSTGTKVMPYSTYDTSTQTWADVHPEYFGTTSPWPPDLCVGYEVDWLPDAQQVLGVGERQAVTFTAPFAQWDDVELAFN